MPRRHERDALEDDPPSIRTTGDPVDSTPPDLKVWGPKKQSPQNDKPIGARDLDVRVSCGDEACTARATGKLTNVKRYKLIPVSAVGSQAGGTFHLGPLLWEQGQRREVLKALDEGENVQAKVTVKATDAAGNVATAKRTITLVK